MRRSLSSLRRRWILIFLHFQTIVLFAQRVQLTWTPPDAQNISHYGIYRTTHQDSTFVLLNTVNSPNSTYLDEAILSNVHYFWVVTTIDGNGNESGFSNIVDTTVVRDAVAPAIITQPRNATARVGETAQFSIVAGGVLPMAYQWQQNGRDIPGATNASYTTPSVTLADNGSKFHCVATNFYGSATSVEATLTVVSGTGRRVADGEIVLYAFEEGNGAVVKDVSGIGAPLPAFVNNHSAASQHLVILVRRENNRWPFQSLQRHVSGTQPYKAPDDDRIDLLQLLAGKVVQAFPIHGQILQSGRAVTLRA